jgi:hypothetical protein
MSDHTFYDAEFFAEQERPSLRKQVNEWIARYCATTGKSFSYAWRRAYLELEDRSGFRGPDRGKLDAIEEAGLMVQLLDVAKNLAGLTADEATEIHKGIPDYSPHHSEREGWRQFPTERYAPVEMIPHRSDR